MLYHEITPETFLPWSGAPINEVVYPLAIETLWSAEELADIGLYAPRDTGVPDGKVATGFTVERVDGVVTKVYALEDAPPEPFGDLSRPAFIFMMGKLGITKQNVYDLIDQMPDGDEKTLARIVFDEQQSFARDNALLATLTAAAGLTTQQVDDAWRTGESLTW